MDLNKKLEEKKEELRKLVARYNVIQQEVSNLNKAILEVNGAVKVLDQLVSEKLAFEKKETDKKTGDK